MKLKRDDNVVVIAGRDKGMTGKITAVIPTEGKVVVEGINMAKRHTKPSAKNPRGGILDITRPIDVSKLMVLDPASGMPARVGYSVKADGTKERVFKVSPNHKSKPTKVKAATKVAKAEKVEKVEKTAKTVAKKAGEK
jgi:large subunit ribosomal protein L24